MTAVKHEMSGYDDIKITASALLNNGDYLQRVNVEFTQSFPADVMIYAYDK